MIPKSVLGTLFTDRASAVPFSFRYDGISSVEILPKWDYEVGEGDSEVRHHRVFEKDGGLSVHAAVRRFEAHHAIEWTLTFRNDGATETTILSDIQALDRTWAEEGTVDVDYAHGSSCAVDDFMPHRARLGDGERLEFGPLGGRSSDGVLPFFNLWSAGAGVVIAVGWSGQWHVSFDRGPTDIRLRAGLERTHLKLYPGESIRMPRILMLEWSGDDPIAGSNGLRRLLLEHYIPRTTGHLDWPPIAHMTMSTFHKTQVVSEASELAALERAAALGVEAFWVDACWFGNTRAWWSEVGNWFVRTADFPNGLRPIADAAHNVGMKFVLWFEPERVHLGTAIERDHADYILKTENAGEDMLLNLGHPGARAHVTRLIRDLIAETGIDIYRQDCNLQPLPYWRAADADDRIGVTEIRHIEGLYQMWDELLEAFPGLVIDNCASGGRRIDLETLSRAVPLWRSDFSDVGGPGPGMGQGLHLGDQSQTAGLSRWVPLHSAGVWSFAPYEFRSAMAAGVVLYCDIREPTFPAADASRAIEELRALREYYVGDFYPLIEVTPEDDTWVAYQYHRVDLDAGFAMFLRRHESGTAAVEVGLRGLSADLTYDVTLKPTFVDVSQERMSARELGALEVRIETQPGSMVVEYKGRSS